MGPKCLIDTNIVIHYLANSLPADGIDYLNSVEPYISVIPRIELLCGPTNDPQEQKVLEDFVADSDIFNLDESIVLKTIEIRKKYKIKIPDAIIAATALVQDLILITRNIGDIIEIEVLDIVNPFDLQLKNL